MMLCWAMRSSHSIRGAVAAVAAVAMLAALAAQVRIGAVGQQPIVPPPLQETGAFVFSIFLRGMPIGTEQVALTRTAEGWTIAASGRLGAPLDVLARRIQVRYTADWRPIELTFDGTVRGQAQAIRTNVQGTIATSAITSGAQTSERSDTIDASALLILPNSFFGPYE